MVWAHQKRLCETQRKQVSNGTNPGSLGCHTTKFTDELLWISVVWRINGPWTRRSIGGLSCSFMATVCASLYLSNISRTITQCYQMPSIPLCLPKRPWVGVDVLCCSLKYRVRQDWLYPEFFARCDPSGKISRTTQQHLQTLILTCVKVNF